MKVKIPTLNIKYICSLFCHENYILSVCVSFASFSVVYLHADA